MYEVVSSRWKIALPIARDDSMPHRATKPVVSTPAARWSFAGVMISLLGVAASGIYLANPSPGIVEFIPDIFPGVGNIDEFVASAIFLTCLSRLGINIIPGRPPLQNSPKD
jgi:hypothetical protein